LPPHLPAAHMKVYKFGGASVKDAAGFRNVASILHQQNTNGQLLIVVSALGKTTNALEAIFQAAFSGQTFQGLLHDLAQGHQTIANDLFPDAGHPAHQALSQLFRELEVALSRFRTADFDCEYDQIVPFGELLSSTLLHFWLHEAGIFNHWLDCRTVFRTDANWREATIDWTITEPAVLAGLPEILQQKCVVTQGFIGGTADGFTTTLGREGSDYSAAVFAYCLQADSMTIWKDVAGLLNADPKLFPNSIKYEELSFQETIEMAYYGASVIHPKTIQPLASRKIPLHVKSFLNPAASGTVIHECRHETLPPAFIVKQQQTLLSVSVRNLAFVSEQHLSQIFQHLSALRIKVNVMQNSAVSFSLCIDAAPAKFSKLVALLSDQFQVHYNHGLQLFTIKNCTDAALNEFLPNREILLEQRTRHTYQAVCRPQQ
jgi:aspartate kinase